tara:strand:- start:1149 stop:2621 length:1473 start_codon:yes stop_codon:yes gene_type:complete
MNILTYTSQAKCLTAFLLIFLLAGCNSSNNDALANTKSTVAPSVNFTFPGNAITGVSIKNKVTATFSEEMDATSIDIDSFTLASAGQANVVGTVSLDTASNTAIFEPNSDLGSDTEYTATLTTAIKNGSGKPLANNYVWTFTTADAVDTSAPEVTVTNPLNMATNVAINRSIRADFSEGLNPASISTSSFTLSYVDNVTVTAVTGSVSYGGTSISFNPTSNLLEDTLYTATLTTAITDLAEPANALASEHEWTFTTGALVALGPNPVNLRTAGNFVILTKTGITNIPASDITGNIGASPITAAAMDNVTCTEVDGTIYGADAAYTGSGAITCFAGASTDNTLVANAVLDMGTAYSDAAGRSSPDHTELGAGDISGMTLSPGLYKWGTGLLIATDVTLSGGANDVWVFQVAGDITQENASSIILSGGALPKNIFWQVGGGTGVAIGTTAHFEGVVLAEKGINVQTGASINGRLLSQTAVTLQQNVVTQPAL